MVEAGAGEAERVARALETERLQELEPWGLLMLPAWALRQRAEPGRGWRRCFGVGLGKKGATTHGMSKAEGGTGHGANIRSGWEEAERLRGAGRESGGHEALELRGHAVWGWPQGNGL